MKQALLREIFPEVSPKTALFDIPVCELTISSQTGALEVLLAEDCDASEDLLFQGAELIRMQYGLKNVLLRAAEGNDRTPEELLLSKLGERNPSLCIAIEKDIVDVTRSSLRIFGRM